jgi:hypothetical protein
MRTLKNSLSFILIACFLSCTDENPAPAPPKLPERTVIAYFCGDNNLSSEIDIKTGAMLEGMKRMGETNNHLVVYADYRDAMPELMEIMSAGITVLEEYTELNSASPYNFSRILQKIIEDFPAKSYGLICFSHASGWLPKGALNNPGGFAENASPASSPALRSIFEDEGSEMSVADFAGAIPLLPGGGKWEFILFESCYMAGVEVVYELRDKTRYIISSAAEMLSNGFAEIYPEHLACLFSPVPELTAFAKAYFDNWNLKEGTSRSATISVINPDKIDALALEVRNILAGGKNIDIDGIQHFNRNSYHLFFDLSDYIASIAIPEQKNNFERVLSQVVEYRESTPQFMPGYPHAFSLRIHCGLTTYIKQAQFPGLNEEYDKTAWAKAVGITE